MARLWFMGEALIDFVPVTAADGGRAYAPRCGGSPMNAAKAAAIAGAEVAFMGALSTDMFGEMLARDLLAHGIDIAAGVHHRAALARLVEDQRAVLLERRDRNDDCLNLCHGRAA
ncbi:MAG: PfkB family carbohydrate kinase [Gemmobacter sp.]